MLAAVCGALTVSAQDVCAAKPVQNNLYQQRATYMSAISHLRAGRSSSFRRAKSRLTDYALYPYLQYHDLQSRLSSANAGEVLDFRNAHSDLPVAEFMYWRWLKRLGQRRDWRRFLSYYETTNDTELRCYRMRALYGSGRRDEAFAGVAELWTAAKSQLGATPSCACPTTTSSSLAITAMTPTTASISAPSPWIKSKASSRS